MSQRGTFIAVAGPIGVGKSVLARIIADQIGAKLVPEAFQDNPYLERFYAPGGIERWGLATEMSFLWQRFDQMMEIEAKLARGEHIVTDWAGHFQSLIFSRLTLNDEDFETYRACFERMMRVAPRPDRLVLLDADLDTLLQRIAGRGREMEAQIDPTYVASLREAYAAWRLDPPAPLVVLNTTNLPIPTSEEARAEALDRVWMSMGCCPILPNARYPRRDVRPSRSLARR